MHQHFNDDRERTARLVRVHNFDALYDMMRILLDPLNLSRIADAGTLRTFRGRLPDHLDGRPEA